MDDEVLRFGECACHAVGSRIDDMDGEVDPLKERKILFYIYRYKIDDLITSI